MHISKTVTVHESKLHGIICNNTKHGVQLICTGVVMVESPAAVELNYHLALIPTYYT